MKTTGTIGITHKIRQQLLAFLPLFVICLMLVLPAIAAAIFEHGTGALTALLSRLLVSCAVFVVPVAAFYKNIKLYFYLLTFWIVLSPLFIFCVIWLDVSPNFSLIALLLQTNAAELQEATKGYRLLFLLCTLLYTLSYLLIVKKSAHKQISFKRAAPVSAAALVLIASYGLTKKYKDYYKLRDVLEETYPLGIFSGLYQAHAFMKKNTLDASKFFSFHAYRKDSIADRKVFVFIIGESSRYDRWGINGYSKQTSPLLAAQSNLVSFSNVIAGCNVTWMSVPQMITRANPDNIQLQFNEKSVLAAFKDAGFKTVWLSNQSDKEIFWSGTITLHAKTADVSRFCQPETQPPTDEPYGDARLLPLLDSIIKADTKNIFFVLHTNGNHWTYSDRYPPAFDFFKPSGHSQTLTPFAASGKEAISNSYDNSIRYADYVIDSVIKTLRKHHLISAVTFLSDHGDDLFDQSEDKMNFHLSPSVPTLHVPLFVWTSDAYQKQFTGKVRLLTAHRAKKIGPENTFYTLLDLANISFSDFDSTKSLAAASFIESTQKYYDNDEKKAFFYSRFKTPK